MNTGSAKPGTACERREMLKLNMCKYMVFCDFYVHFDALLNTRTDYSMVCFHVRGLYVLLHKILTSTLECNIHLYIHSICHTYTYIYIYIVRCICTHLYKIMYRTLHMSEASCDYFYIPKATHQRLQKHVSRSNQIRCIATDIKCTAWERLGFAAYEGKPNNTKAMAMPPADARRGKYDCWEEMRGQPQQGQGEGARQLVVSNT